MILVGLTGWGDHENLYGKRIPSRDKLKEYSAYFPIVEVDASFYAIQPLRNSIRWVEETPSIFQFIVKAYQGMTGHLRKEIPFASKAEMFSSFRDSLEPYLQTGKLAMVLFQFPPWFDCKKENVDYLRWCKDQMGEIPCALEFRHQSWFRQGFKEKTIAFMKAEGWIHSVCDEPQAGEGSIPTVLEITSPEKVLIRFHGRNIHGWNKKAGQNWREVRYLYRYNKNELMEWKEHLLKLKESCKNVYVVFNNNSGGDAADNAFQLLELMDLEYKGLSPKQLDLF